jgi:hypothetical protein
MASFQFNNPSGSSYFFIETITTSSFYTGNTPKYMEGVWDVYGANTYAEGGFDMTPTSASYALNGSSSVSINGINWVFTGSAAAYDATNYYMDVSVFADTTTFGFISEFMSAFSSWSSLFTPILDNIGFVSTADPLYTMYYGGVDQAYGNTIPYSYEGFTGTFSGGSNYNFGLVTSSYIAGVVVQPGYSAFDFTPNITIPVDTIQFRGTGEYTVTITP